MQTIKMSFSAIIELLINLDHLRIYSSDACGVYKLRMRVYSQASGEKASKNLQSPYLTTSSSVRENASGNGKDDPKKSKKVEIRSGEVYVNKLLAFYESNYDNITPIEEILLYRIDLESYPDLWDGVLIVEADLCVQVTSLKGVTDKLIDRKTCRRNTSLSTTTSSCSALNNW